MDTIKLKKCIKYNKETGAQIDPFDGWMFWVGHRQAA